MAVFVLPAMIPTAANIRATPLAASHLCNSTLFTHGDPNVIGAYFGPEGWLESIS